MCRSLICLTLVLGLAGTASADLVGYWALDGDALDSSANGNDGTVFGAVAPATDRFGDPNGAMSFAGGGGDNIDVGNPPEFNMPGAMTITAWVYLDSTSPLHENRNGRILGKMGGGGSRSWSSGIEINVSSVPVPGTIQVASDGNTVVSLSDDASLPLDEWVHYAGVYTPGVSLEVYLNGDLAEIVTTGVPATQFSDNGHPALIGNRPACGNCGWYGSLDEVRLYDEALSEPQIEEVMALPGPATTLTLSMRRTELATIDETTELAVLVPADCLAGGDLDVTVTSSDPGVVKPVGSEGSVVVPFLQGSSSAGSVSLEIVGPGQATILATADGCPTGEASQVTVTVHPMESLDLAVLFDLMRVGRTQQATVTGQFGPAGVRVVSAAADGTTYGVEPEGVIEVTEDGLITALAEGQVLLTASNGGLTSDPPVAIEVISAGVLPDLVGHWALDGDGLDSSGRGHNGIIAGDVAPAVDRFGDPAGAMSFAGGGGDSIDVGDPADFNITGAMTIAAWVYLDSTSPNHGNRNGRILGKMAGGGQRAWSSGIEMNVGGVPIPGTIQVAGNGNNVVSLSDDAPLPLDEWVHYAGVYTPGTSLEVYLNGDLAEIRATGIPASQFSDNGHAALIGNRPACGNCGWYGSLDEVRLYNGALSESQIEEVMTGLVCADPFADVDSDGDVDQMDFAILQRCLTFPGGLVPGTECDCLDREDMNDDGRFDPQTDGNGEVSMMDVIAFEACASGATVPADPACDD